jgi:hypothetical protein
MQLHLTCDQLHCPAPYPEPKLCSMGPHCALCQGPPHWILLAAYSKPWQFVESGACAGQVVVVIAASTSQLVDLLEHHAASASVWCDQRVTGDVGVLLVSLRLLSCFVFGIRAMAFGVHNFNRTS